MLLSQSMMVWSLWAMVSTVQSRNLSLIFSWIKASVLGSRRIRRREKLLLAQNLSFKLNDQNVHNSISNSQQRKRCFHSSVWLDEYIVQENWLLANIKVSYPIIAINSFSLLLILLA